MDNAKLKFKHKYLFIDQHCLYHQHSHCQPRLNRWSRTSTFAFFVRILQSYASLTAPSWNVVCM